MALDLYGTDILLTDDLSDGLVLVSGRRLLIQDILHRLQTARGTLVDDPSFGMDVRSWVNETMTPARLFSLGAAVGNEAARDDRVFSAQASATFDAATKKLTLALKVEDAEGPFAFTASVSNLTVEFLALTS